MKFRINLTSVLATASLALTGVNAGETNGVYNPHGYFQAHLEKVGAPKHTISVPPVETSMQNLNVTRPYTNSPQSHLETLRAEDGMKQSTLGHVTNVWVYNSKTDKLEKKQTWVPERKNRFGQTVFIGPVPVGFDSKSVPYFDTHSAPVLLRGIESKPLGDEEASKIRETPLSSTNSPAFPKRYMVPRK